MPMTHAAPICRRLLSAALLACGLLLLRGAARRPRPRAVDAALDAALRLVDGGDGFLTLS